MSFFGFDTTLPEHKGQQQQQQQQGLRPGFATNDSTSFGHGFNTQQGGGEEDDLAVYNWGEGAATNLLEGGDDMNDETFGDVGDIGTSTREYANVI
jgi:DNA topoisomerase 2-associated protein PAT1